MKCSYCDKDAVYTTWVYDNEPYNEFVKEINNPYERTPERILKLSQMVNDPDYPDYPEDEG